MELNKITTSFPLPIHRNPSSELSSSPQNISYISGNSSPKTASSTNECPSLASDIDTSSPSDTSSGSSPPDSRNHLPTAVTGSLPNTTFVTPFYRHLRTPSRPSQGDQSKMSITHGLVQDRRTQLSNAAHHLPRSSESSNWRTPAVDIQDRSNIPPMMSPVPAVSMDYNQSFQQGRQSVSSQYPPFGWTVPQPSLQAFPRTTAANTNFYSGSTSVAASASSQRLDSGHMINQDFYGYGFDRGGGKITLLVPVDMLPPLAGIPQTLTDPSGIVILPPPNRRGPQGLSSNPGPMIVRNSHGTGDHVQSQIDSIVASSSSSAQPRRTKVYCDKWVHEGTCAFAQQGCKFKHEMPMDKATQHDLGLFQGLPTWWKKHQAELQRQSRQDETSDAPICLTRSRETSPHDRGGHRELHNVSGAFSRPQSTASGSSSNNSGPGSVLIASNVPNRVGNPTIPSAKLGDNVPGLDASRHKENVPPAQQWPSMSELGSHLPSPYGPIGTPRKPGRDSNVGNSVGPVRYSMFNFQPRMKSAKRENDGVAEIS
ncbi:hypothetical protein V8F20_005855 [Naviculisporaceae sp. PSN 640]